MPRRSHLVALALLASGCIKNLYMADGTTSGSTGDATTTSTSAPTTGDSVCGDGQLDPGEQCDDGNMVAGDGCENDCTTTPGELCGNGDVDPGEDCDDGNAVGGDGCENNCRFTPNASCGDGQVDPGEQCDDGNAMSGDGCENNCTQTPDCGDGVVGPGEQCDDGDDDDADACLADCTPAKCGDGIVWSGMESCDDGRDNGTYDHCLADCSGPGERCGDGVRNGFEECDDTNQIDDDDCSNECVAPRIVFVTANLYNGNLGGIVGADAKCAQSAMLGALPANVQWVAWISDGSVAPASPGRMDSSYTGYYKLTTGDIVAHGWDDLTDGSLVRPIDVSEGKVQVVPYQAWSNTTDAGGTSDTTHCQGWTSMNIVDTGRFGAVGAADATWTDAALNNPISCTSSFHLYCFQNSPIP